MIASEVTPQGKRSPAGSMPGQSRHKPVSFPAITAFRLAAGNGQASYMSNGEHKPNGDPPEVTLWGGDSRR